MTAAAAPRPGTTLRRRVALLVGGLLGLALLIAGVAGLALRSQIQARDAVVRRLDPALLATSDLETALADEERGVRGYLLSGEVAFLEPYGRGRQLEGASSATLGRLLGRDPELAARAGVVRERTERWRAEAAEPALDAVARGGASGGGPAALGRSQALFGEVEAALRSLRGGVESARLAALARLDRAARRVVGVLVGAVVVLLVAGAGSFGVLRRWVTEPLEAVGGDARRVAGGDLQHVVRATGPPEIARLAGDIEAMRGRIVAELRAVEEARRALDAQRAELQRSNAELEQFAYVASHDLQEPLRKVASFCQLIEKRYRDQLDERGVQYIDFAVDGAKRMQQLIADLLAFSRVGRTTERFQAVDLAAVAAGAVASLDHAVADAGATVRVGPLPAVHGDPGLLAAVVQNLVANAIKFRGEAPPEVEVTAAHDPAAGRWRITVADNGIGIPPEYRERIFVIFQRLHARDAYEGTGIGLALCRKIVEFHGGDVRVEEGDGPGTRITFSLPDAAARRTGEDGAGATVGVAPREEPVR